MASLSSKLFIFSTGALAGAVAGLLLAPVKGKRARKIVKEKARLKNFNFSNRQPKDRGVIDLSSHSIHGTSKTDSIYDS